MRFGQCIVRSTTSKVFLLIFDHEPGDLFPGWECSQGFYRTFPSCFVVQLEQSTVQAVEKRFRLAEVAVPFRERASGSNPLRMRRMA
jgi:hypothetical protein